MTSMIWALGWLVAIGCGMFCAVQAKSMNRDPLGWFLIGLAGGVLGVIALLWVGPLAPPASSRSPAPSDDELALYEFGDPESRAIAARWAQEIKAQEWNVDRRPTYTADTYTADWNVQPATPPRAWERTNTGWHVKPATPQEWTLPAMPPRYADGWRVKRRA
jgi:hypothetical protein